MAPIGQTKGKGILLKCLASNLLRSNKKWQTASRREHCCAEADIFAGLKITFAILNLSCHLATLLKVDH